MILSLNEKRIERLTVANFGYDIFLKASMKRGLKGDVLFNEE